MIRVLLYDDSEAVRSSVSELLNNTQGFLLVGAFADVMSVELQVEELKPDIVLMDINMPGMNGFETSLAVW